MSKSIFPQNCRSVTLSRGFQPSHSTWVNKMRFDRAAEKTRVWGRIKDTGVNFIVEGWKVAFHPNRTEWVQIPCANLATAQMHLISVMDKLSFEIEKTRNANGF
jgi:pantothenate kinase-related protein Tda10